MQCHRWLHERHIPMIAVRPSSERGRSSTGWLHSAHSFSFGDYFDLRHQGHGNLLVLNDDTVAPGKGFGSHGHRDMEIVSYVLSMNAEATLWAGLFDGDAETATQALDPQRLAYVHVAQGTVQVNGVPLAAGDGALLEDENPLTLHHGTGADVLVFDLARR